MNAKTEKIGDVFIEKVFRLAESEDYLIDCGTREGRIKAYQKCDVLRTAIGKSSQAIANLNVWALDDSGRENTSPLAKKVLAKLMRPNEKEDFKRFFKKLDGQVKLHGKAYVEKFYSRVYKDTMYYIIPNKLITVEYYDSFNSLFEREVKHYVVSNGHKRRIIQPENVHVFYDISMNEDDNNSVFGSARIEGMSSIISVYAILWEALMEMYGNRGALNLISMGVKDAGMMSMAALKSEKESMIKRLSNRFGLRRGQDKNAVISTDAKVHPLTAKMSDMEFDTMIVECKKAIGSAFDIPAPLLDIESSRYKNMTEAIKNLYTNAAVPTAEYFFSEWLQMTGYTDLPFKLKADYSHLEFYQDAKREEAVAFAQMAQAISTLANVELDGKKLITNEQALIKLDLI